MKLLQVDNYIWIIWCFLSLFGVMMIASVGVEVSTISPFKLLERHCIYLLASFFIVQVILRIPLSFWSKFSYVALIVIYLLLAFTLIPELSKSFNGSRRWISIFNLSFQASEWVKLFFLIYFSGYMYRHHAAISSNMLSVFKPVLVLTPIIIGLLLQPDLGTSVILISVVGMTLFLFARWRDIFLFSVLFSLFLGLAIFYQSYRLRRFLSFLDPWKDALDSGFQLTQAFIAIGRGEWFGLGVGQGFQKFWIPEAYNDFILSVIGEEFGVLGISVLILIFFVLFLRGLYISFVFRKYENTYEMIIVYIATLFLSIQAYIHMGVNLGLLPTKGLTLPFVSYGGNSLLVCSFLIALLMRAEKEMMSLLKKNKRKSWRV